MKKLILALLIVALCAGVACAVPDQDPNRRISMYVKSFTGVTVAQGASVGSTINSNDLILGFTVVPGAAGQSCGVGLYEQSGTTNAGCTDANIFAEAEVIANGSSITIWFPYAKQLTAGNYLHILCGDTKAVVTVYYEDK